MTNPSSSEAVSTPVEVDPELSVWSALAERAAASTGILQQAIGRRRFVAGAGAAIGSIAMAAALPAGLANAAVVAGASKFVPLSPFRVLDTRNGVRAPARTVGANRYRLSLGGYTDPGTKQLISATARSIVINLTIVNGGHPLMNVIQVFPSDASTIPEVSVMNPYRQNSATANMVTCTMSALGEIDIFCKRDANVIVDVLGFYEPTSAAVRDGRFIPSAPLRAYDSRQGRPRVPAQGSIVVDVTGYTRSDAAAVVINLTGVLSQSFGYLSAIPEWQTSKPETSTVNFTVPGDTVAGSAIVPVRTVGGRRKIRVFGSTNADVIVDVQGQFSGSSSAELTDGLFVPLRPQRILDTRTMWRDKIGVLGRLWDNWYVEAPLTNHGQIDSSMLSSIGAVAINLSAIFTRPNPGTGDRGYLLVSAAGVPAGLSSTLNWKVANAFSANHAMPTVSWQGLQVRCIGGSGVLIDVAGYYLGSPRTRSLPVPSSNQMPPPANPPWTCVVPNLYSSSRGRYGVVKTVFDGPNADNIIDRGDLWHWTNTGGVADPQRRTLIFGHRTDADAHYRNIHVLPVGSEAYVDTVDGRRYTYKYVGKRLAKPTTDAILAAAAICPTPSISVVSCTAGYSRPGKAWDEPTSLDWRLVSTFQYVSWTLARDV